MTPKRIEATLFIIRKQKNAERLEELVVAQNARTSDKDRLKNFVKALQQ
jgi:hypothetical protein